MGAPEKFRIFARPCDIFYVYNIHSMNTLRNLLDTLRQVHRRLAVPTKLGKVRIPLPIISQIISTEVTLIFSTSGYNSNNFY